MSARDLFEQITKAGWQGLEEWAANGEPETFELEFKGKGNEAPKLGDYDKTHIGKTVSGFANASGGVLLIGVDVDKAEGGDQMKKLCPTANLAAYVAAIDRHLAQCTDPRVPGAQVVPIPKPASSDEGIVAVYVPASDGGPFRAKGGPRMPPKGERFINDLYFARVGAQTVVLEHTHLAAMFGRVPPPVLSLEIKRNPDGSYRLWVHNSGRGIAQHVLVRVQVYAAHGDDVVRPKSDLYGIPGWVATRRRSQEFPSATPFEFGGVIYSNDDVPVTDVRFPDNTAYNTVHVRGRIDAEGMMPVRIEVDEDV